VPTEQKLRKRRKYQAIRKIIVNCLANKVDICDFAFFASCLGIKSVWWRNINGKNILITGSVEKKDRILDDGTYLSFVVATDVLFCEVEDRKKFLIYDLLNVKVEYSNDQDKAREPNAKTILVNYLPDELVDKIAKKIEKKLEKEKNKHDTA
jgi:hypothetical protein